MLKIDSYYMEMGDLVTPIITRAYIRFVRNPSENNLKSLFCAGIDMGFYDALCEYSFYMNEIRRVYTALWDDQQEDYYGAYEMLLNAECASNDLIEVFSEPVKDTLLARFLELCREYITLCMV